MIKDILFRLKTNDASDEQLLVSVLKEYQRALYFYTLERIRTGNVDIWGSKEIEADIFSGNKTSIAFDSMIYAKAYFKSMGINNQKASPDVDERAVKELVLPDPVCVWTKRDYKLDESGKNAIDVKVQIPDQPEYVRRKSTKWISLSIKLEPEGDYRNIQELVSDLRKKHKSTLSIVYKDGQFCARLKYMVGADKKPEVQENTASPLPLQWIMSMTKGEYEDLLYRGKRLNIRGHGFNGTVRYFMVHPVVVVRMVKSAACHAPDPDTAECMALLLNKLNIQYLKKECDFQTFLTQEQFDKICYYYISDKEHFMNAWNKTPSTIVHGTLCFAGNTKEKYLYFRDVKKGGNPRYNYNIPFFPIVVSETEEFNTYEARSDEAAARYERIFRENGINYLREGNVFTAYIKKDDLGVIYSCVDGLRPAPAYVNLMKEWILDNYGVIIANFHFANIKKKYGFCIVEKNKKEESEKKSRHVRCPVYKEILIIRAFIHFGMMTEKEGNEIIDGLEKRQ